MGVLPSRHSVLVNCLCWLLLGAIVLAGDLEDEEECTGVQMRGKWDLLVLVLSWPTTACHVLEDACSAGQVRDRFVIHGLWPMYNDGSWPVYCKSTPFKYDEISALRANLDKYWTDLQGSPEDWALDDGGPHLWKEQWTTHGVCLSKTEHNYFSQALALRKSFHLESYLWSSGIHPSNEKEWLAEDIQRSLAYGLGQVDPLLICSPPRSSASDDSDCSLHEVRICLDKNRMPMECPPGVIRCAKKEGTTCNNRRVKLQFSEGVDEFNVDTSAQRATPTPPSFGFVFVLYFFLAFFFYIAGGCAFNSRVSGAKLGLEACPNLGFWRDLPSLVKDGCEFSWRKLCSATMWVREMINRYGASDRERANIVP